MARLYPSREIIEKFKVPPTSGEKTILSFLESILDDSYEIYFNPYLNGDRPDIIIMRESCGVLVIEVKDWNLNNFTLNVQKEWIYLPNNSIVKSPIKQVLKYKRNLFDLHVNELLKLKIYDRRHFSIVSCLIYFHCANQYTIDNLLVEPYKKDHKYLKFLKHNVDLLGKDSLNKESFRKLLKKHYLDTSQHTSLFTNDIYRNFKRILTPALHLQNQGTTYRYSRKQKEIIYSQTLEQRIRGVFGSGKTTVLAARAVQAYKRALNRTMSPRILILTFNITLKNFIHDKLMQVNETFPVESFIIINYHSFINAELNNLNINIDIPTNCSKAEISEYLENTYYSNISLFERYQDRIIKYDAVLIDEIQDYRRSWMDIIKRFFRDPNGDYVLFGDVKQNIYKRPTNKKDIVTNVLGVNDLKYCFRSDSKILEFAKLFQQNVFGDKYDIDEFSENNVIGTLGLTIEKIGHINYMFLENVDSITSLYNIVRGNILHKINNVAPNDITILGYTTKLLQMFDCYYRYCSRERTNSMFETIEIMYMTQINRLATKSDSNKIIWFNNIYNHLTEKMYPYKQTISFKDKLKIYKHITKLFTIYDLYREYPNIFHNRLDEACKTCNISLHAYIAFREYYQTELDEFTKDVYEGDYSKIRENKKLHFWMNSGTIKISTINSFKGWESDTVFLVLESKYDNNTPFNESFDELLYTGITRCRKNLIIINYGNKEYDKIIRPLIDCIK